MFGEDTTDIGRRVMRKRIILMIDDVALNHKVAREVLQNTYQLYEAHSASEGFDILDAIVPDLILLDIVMPEMDGFEMLRRLKMNKRLRNIPVIFLTADITPEAEVEGFNCGIVDYITKPFVPAVMLKRIETQIALAEYEQNLEERVAEKVVEMEKMYDLISVSFAGLVESRDGVTGGHLKNTALYFKAFIEYLMKLPQYRDELTPSYVKKAIRSAPLHDVGKIAIEDAVLQKASSLNSDEFERMKQHAVIGGDIFAFIKARISDKEFGDVAEKIARYHHEKWDGTGYPEGLKGEEIPLVARIMSIVDVYDALTSKRPYKEPFSHEKAMELIVSNEGSFDPHLVQAFITMSEDINLCLRSKERMLVQESYFEIKR